MRSISARTCNSGRLPSGSPPALFGTALEDVLRGRQAARRRRESCVYRHPLNDLDDAFFGGRWESRSLPSASQGPGRSATMNRRPLTLGREFATPSASTFDGRGGRRGRRRGAWVALGPLALGMVLALGASPVAALPPTLETGFGGAAPVPRVNGGS